MNNDDPTFEDLAGFEPTGRDKELLKQNHINLDIVQVINTFAEMYTYLDEDSKGANEIEVTEANFSNLFQYVSGISAHAYNLSESIKNPKISDLEDGGMSEFHADVIWRVKKIESPKTFFANRENAKVTRELIKYLEGHLKNFDSSIVTYEPVILELDSSDMSSDCFNYIELTLKNIKNCREIAKSLISYMSPEK